MRKRPSWPSAGPQLNTGKDIMCYTFFGMTWPQQGSNTVPSAPKAAAHPLDTQGDTLHNYKHFVGNVLSTGKHSSHAYRTGDYTKVIIPRVAKLCISYLKRFSPNVSFIQFYICIIWLSTRTKCELCNFIILCPRSCTCVWERDVSLAICGIFWFQTQPDTQICLLWG